MLPLCPSPLTLIFVYVYLYGSLLISGVRSGTSPEGSSCSTANNRIDKLSHRFVDDCDDKTFCSGPVGGSCIPKRCRTDVFPFGYKDGDVLPPLCDPGSFCPDEGGGCVPLVEVGRPCQMNQDRQCAPPPNWQELASDWNSNGSVCLGSVCSFANVTLGQPCSVDSTDYISPGPAGQEFITTVIRHDCRTPQLFCNLISRQCEPTKSLGSQCSYDQECQSYNCESRSKTCIFPPEKLKGVPVWQYTLITITISLIMVTALGTLVFIHKRQRLRRHQALREYYFEQMDFRQSIAALHNAAAEDRRRMKEQ